MRATTSTTQGGVPGDRADTLGGRHSLRFRHLGDVPAGLGAHKVPPLHRREAIDEAEGEVGDPLRVLLDLPVEDLLGQQHHVLHRKGPDPKPVHTQPVEVGGRDIGVDGRVEVGKRRADDRRDRGVRDDREHRQPFQDHQPGPDGRNRGEGRPAVATGQLEGVAADFEI